MSAMHRLRTGKSPEPAAAPAPVTTDQQGRTMNILGLKISVDRSPSAKTKWTRRTGVMGATIALVAGSGIAYASWTTNGLGVGAAQAGSSSPLTISVASVSTAGGSNLFPTGSASVPMVVNIHNPNHYGVVVSSIVVSTNTAPTSVSGQNNATTCKLTPTDTTGVTLLAGTYSSFVGSASIPAQSDGILVTSANAVKMATTSDDGCQNGQFNFSGVTVNAASG